MMRGEVIGRSTTPMGCFTSESGEAREGSLTRLRGYPASADAVLGTTKGRETLNTNGIYIVMWKKGARFQNQWQSMQ